MLTPFQDDGAIDWPALDALTEWYLKVGVAGLFAVSGSSEVYELTRDEQLALARRVVARVAGRVPVVASAIEFGPVAQQCEFVRAMAVTGVHAVILATCQLASQNEGDAWWLERADELLSLSRDIPLGLYEIPSPYKRLLNLEQMRWAAASGRFVWFKDTSCAADVIEARIEAVRGTAFRVFNAHTPTLLDSLLAEAHGFSGIGANYCPAIYVQLCNRFREEPEQALRIQEYLTRLDAFAGTNYPASAKIWLSMAGVPMRPVCRVKSGAPAASDMERLIYLLRAAERLREERGIQA